MSARVQSPWAAVPRSRPLFLPTQSYQIIVQSNFAAFPRNLPRSLNVLRPQCPDPQSAGLRSHGHCHPVEERKAGRETNPRPAIRVLLFPSSGRRHRKSRGTSRTPSVPRLSRVARSHTNENAVGYTVFAFNQTIHKKLDPKTHQNLAQTLVARLKPRPGVVFLKRITIVLDEDSEKGFGLVCNRNRRHYPLPPSRVKGLPSTGQHKFIDFLRLRYHRVNAYHPRDLVACMLNA